MRCRLGRRRRATSGFTPTDAFFIQDPRELYNHLAGGCLEEDRRSRRAAGDERVAGNFCQSEWACPQVPCGLMVWRTLH